MPNAKLDIDIAGFQNNINTAKSILKGLNAEMKNADAEFKATGNAEKALADKTKTLNSQLNMQKSIADQAQQALKAMSDAGVKPTDQAYQKLYATMMNAQAGMNEAQAALNALSSSEQTAAQSADGLATSVQSIGKKMSLDQVISGIDRITDGLENAAKKAINLGEKIWNSFMDTASWSDDVATMADRMGLTTEQVQKMRVVAGEFEAPVEAMAKTWKKVKTNMASDSDEVKAAFEAVGVSVETVIGQGKYGPITQARDYMDVFWEIGDALMNMSDASEQEQLAQKLLGRSWDEMIPLFKKGREAYESAMNSVTVADDEAIQNNAALKDSVSALEEQFNIFKGEVLGSISPELTKVTESFSGLLGAITEYAKSDEGQELLGKIGTAIEGLIDDIAKIDPEQVVEGFVGVVEGLVSSLEWIDKNKDTVKGAMEAIVMGWAGLEITVKGLSIYKLINGITGLSAADAAAAGTSAGSSWAGAFATAAMKAAPFLVFLYTLLNPASTANDQIDTLFDEETGQLTEEGKKAGLTEQDVIDIINTQNAIKDAETWALESTGLTEKQLSALEGFWTYYMQVRGNPNASDVIKGQYEKYWDLLNGGLFEGQEQQLTAYLTKMGEYFTAGGRGNLDWSFFNIGKDGKPIEVPVELVVKTSAEAVAAQIGTVPINAVLNLSGFAAGSISGILAGLPHFANGTPFVQADNTLALLHKGERVLTANQNRHYTYNSNNYFGNVNLNNGQDIEALCNSIDRHNRRQRSGYGS